MNCKKGDLAMVVGAPPYAQEFLGRIYTCTAPTLNCEGLPSWLVEGNTISDEGYDVRAIEDMFLIPLDAPLNDDETITDKELVCTD